MCKPDSKGSMVRKPSLLMVSTKSFDSHGGIPSAKARLATGAAFILVLIAVEQMIRNILTSIQDYHPLLGDETSRNMLARHIGVDSFSALVVSYFGWKGRHINKELFDATIGRKKGAMSEAYEGRMFTYHPEAQRVIVYFVGYQMKNFYDTLIWDDGALFIAHHILALFSAWGPFQGRGHFYIMFYFGVSEFSTVFLSLLANLDDDHGVPGLGAAFPMTKVVLGAIFAITFVIFRVILWSTISYFYCKDVLRLVKGSDPRKKGYEWWFKYTFFSLAILSLLQIIWLGEIVKIGMEELKGMGLI